VLGKCKGSDPIEPKRAKGEIHDPADNKKNEKWSTGVGGDATALLTRKKK